MNASTGYGSPPYAICFSQNAGRQPLRLVDEPAAWFDYITSFQDLQPGVTLATRKHIEWLLEGVESWNERRERDDFCPDLAGADIREDLHEGRLCMDTVWQELPYFETGKT